MRFYVNVVSTSREQAADFLNYIKAQAQFYASDNVLLTMGGDFTYQAAHFWYQNMDKLIR